MKLPKPLSNKEELSFLEYKKELCEDVIKICEKALKTTKHPEYIEYWKNKRDSFKDQIGEIDRRIAMNRKRALM